MTTMANFDFYQAHPRSVVGLDRPRSIWRRTESNLESDFPGNDIFDMAPSRGLRRIASTLDFSHPGFRNPGSSTMLQSGTEDNYANDNYVNNLLSNDNYADPPYHTATSSRISSMNSVNVMNNSHRINMDSGVPSKRVPFPVPSVFGFSQQRVPYVSRRSTQQQPISRPEPKLNLSNSDPTATTSATNNIKFPVTSNITENLWTLYEEELKKQPPRLRKEHTEPLPNLTTQAEWPPLRRSNGLAREDRGRIWHTKEERDAYTRKSFEDSLFPGGLDAFVNLNRQQRAQVDVINAHSNGVQLRLTSPAPTMRAIPRPRIPPMSGKQLIEDLQEYELNATHISRPSELSRSNSSLNPQSYLEIVGTQQIGLPLDQKTTQWTHDKDGRKRKGFRRGDEALQVALSEKWAVVEHALNVPIDLIPNLFRYFVIKSNCELDVFASLKHGIWTSTDLGNQRVDKAFRDPHRKGPIYLFFSVSGSGKFCGVAEMTGPVDLNAHAGCWSDKRWRGRFTVQWKIVKDIPNSDLRHFRITNNEYKPFTNCRDTQEIFPDVGDQILRLFVNHDSDTSLLQSPRLAPKYAVFEEIFLN